MAVNAKQRQAAYKLNQARPLAARAFQTETRSTRDFAEQSGFTTRVISDETSPQIALTKPASCRNSTAGSTDLLGLHGLLLLQRTELFLKLLHLLL